MHFSHFAAIFPGSAGLLPRVGGGPQTQGPVSNDQTSEAPGPGLALLISAHQTARTERNYGLFDQTFDNYGRIICVLKYMYPILVHIPNSTKVLDMF